jgi:N-acetyl-beta-hexosaminidase
MIDMGRNPHAQKTLRQVVDMMWLFKANYLHLHLSDDQLFTWPSRAFPKLASARAGWTWEDFVALEAYSQARGVTIIPEIDVPGHSGILRREYPLVFGSSSAELATSAKAQAGVEELITELLSVFEATPFVHIGGDEAGGVPADDQRDFINRLDAFIKSKGRRTIVWEGPPLGEGEHKVHEGVIQMNWHTVAFPAQQMLDAGYEVVNASWDPLYIVDHYPRTMFTAVDVQRCYQWDIQRFAHIDPDIATFLHPQRTKTAHGILGFCMPWWEGREENLAALCAPRLAAVAAAAWNRQGEHNFADFQRRYDATLALLEKIAGVRIPGTPCAEPASQAKNLAFKARVRPSAGAAQPPFGPERLSNGIADKFDHFLGFPTAPEPLEILIELLIPAKIGRVVVYETAVGESYELYEVLVSEDGSSFERVGSSAASTRAEQNFVEHHFPARSVHTIKIITHGCHGLTFPSFSRLCEVMAFAE